MTHNKNGAPFVPCYPPEVFGDMGIDHRKTIEKLMESSRDKTLLRAMVGSHWRFSDALPDLDVKCMGKILSQEKFNDVFGGDLEVYIKALIKSREGELLQLDGSWVGIEDIPGVDAARLCRCCWHVQYATSEWQQCEMKTVGMPGAPGVKTLPADEPMKPEEMRRLGSTSVCRLDEQGKPIAMRRAKVLTWGQLLLLGAHNGHTAMEVFAAGSCMERILSDRERSWPRAENKMAKTIAYFGKGGKRHSRTSRQPLVPKGGLPAPAVVRDEGHGSGYPSGEPLQGPQSGYGHGHHGAPQVVHNTWWWQDPWGSNTWAASSSTWWHNGGQ